MIDNYLHRLKVKPEIGTRLVVVSFSVPNPALAQRIVQAHVSHYINRDLDLTNKSRRSAISFLQRELAELKGRLRPRRSHSKRIVAKTASCRSTFRTETRSLKDAWRI